MKTWLGEKNLFDLSFLLFLGMSQTLPEMFMISTHHKPDLGEIREAERNDSEPDLKAQGKTDI